MPDDPGDLHQCLDVLVRVIPAKAQQQSFIRRLAFDHVVQPRRYRRDGHRIRHDTHVANSIDISKSPLRRTSLCRECSCVPQAAHECAQPQLPQPPAPPIHSSPGGTLRVNSVRPMKEDQLRHRSSGNRKVSHAENHVRSHLINKTREPHPIDQRTCQNIARTLREDIDQDVILRYALIPPSRGGYYVVAMVRACGADGAQKVESDAPAARITQRNCINKNPHQLSTRIFLETSFRRHPHYCRPPPELRLAVNAHGSVGTRKHCRPSHMAHLQSRRHLRLPANALTETDWVAVTASALKEHAAVERPFTNGTPLGTCRINRLANDSGIRRVGAANALASSSKLHKVNWFDSMAWRDRHLRDA